MPATIPEPMLTSAWAVLLLVHVPPGVASVSVVADPTHTFVTPPIPAGTGLTVRPEAFVQPEQAFIPVTVPVPLTKARDGSLLVQVPPGVASLNAVVAPGHTVSVPDMGSGEALTVTNATAAQPVELKVKDIEAIPAPTPVTTP